MNAHSVGGVNEITRFRVTWRDGLYLQIVCKPIPNIGTSNGLDFGHKHVPRGTDVALVSGRGSRKYYACNYD